MLKPRWSVFGFTVLWLLTPVTPAFSQMVSKVMITPAVMKELPATTSVVGSVRPNRTSLIGSEVAGLVIELPVREGDFVRQGELICRLQDDTLTLEYEAAVNRLRSLEAAVEVAQATLQRWDFENQRMLRLQSEAKANEKEISDTQTQYLAAQSSVVEAQQRVAEQKSIVELQKTNLQKIRIAAPFDGYITRLYTEVGQWISIGDQVVEIIDLETVQVRVYAPETAFPYMQVGAVAPVGIDALGEVLTGTIKHIIPQADEAARTFPVEVELDNRAHRLGAGMFARVTLISGPAVQSVAVLKDAVVRKDGVSRIWMISDAGPQGTLAIPMPVTLGAEMEQWVAITSGNIAPGMSIVTRGNERLMPFPAPVMIVQEEALLTVETPPAGGAPAGSSSAEKAPSAAMHHSSTQPVAEDRPANQTPQE
ncbi:MAG: p-hydroxybenzoic acid efflux pump subunit AaeA [Phycisphaerae bacterium]|nr:p-hydroxybenzoic acid efflux pump subunit AaeA [Phycisphaerae bacterium]